MSSSVPSKPTLHLLAEDIGLKEVASSGGGLGQLIGLSSEPTFLVIPDWIERADLVGSIEEYLSAWAAFGEHCGD